MSERKKLDFSDVSSRATPTRHKTIAYASDDHTITVERTSSMTSSNFAPGKIYTKSSNWRPSTIVGTGQRPVPKVKSIHRQLRDIFKSHKRSDKDAQFMLKHLGHITFLNDFSKLNPELNSDEALLHVCRHLGYEKHHSGDVIFQEGDESNGKMYIVYSGAVNVVMKKEVEEVGAFEEAIEKAVGSPRNTNFAPSFPPGSHFDPKTPKALWKKVKPVMSIASMKKKDLNSSRRGSIDSNYSQDNEEENLEGEMAATRLQELINLYGVFIDEIPTGGYFGEKALISKINRTATIITSKETEFLTLSSDLFQFVKSRFERTNSRKLNFILDYFPVMERVSDRKHLNNLTYLLEERRYKTYDEIIRQGQEGKDFFVVFEGECVIYKEQEINAKPTSKDAPKLINKSNPRKCVPICTLQPGCFFGEEILFNPEIYNYTVKAASANVIVFAVKKKKFELRFPRGTIHQMENFFAYKNKHYTRVTESNTNTIQLHEPKHVSSPSIQIPMSPEIQANNMKINELVRGIFMPTFNAYKDPDVLRSSESLPWFPKIDEFLPFVKIKTPESDMFYDASMKDLNENKFDFGSAHAAKFDINQANNSRVERMINAKYIGNNYGLNSDKKRSSTSPSPSSRKDVYLGAAISNKVKKMKKKSSKGFNPSTTVQQSTHLYFTDRIPKTTQPTSRVRPDLMSSSVDLRRNQTSPKIEFACVSPKHDYSSPRIDLQSTNFKTENQTAGTDILRENDSLSIKDKEFSDFALESPRLFETNESDPDFAQEFWRRTLKSGQLGVAKKRVYNKILKITQSNNKLLEQGSNKSSFYETMSSRTSSFPEIHRPSNYSIEVGFLAGLKTFKTQNQGPYGF